MGSKYEAVGDPSDVSNINPYTDDFMNQLTNQANMFREMYGTAGEQYSPEAAFNYYFGDFAGGVGNLMDPITGDFARRQHDLAAMGAERGIEQALGILAGSDLVYSGATPQMVSEAAAMPWAEATTNIARMQSGIFGDLMGTGLQVVPGAFAGQRDHLGNMLMGTQQMQGAMAAPEWWQPTYVEQPGLWDRMMDIGQLAVGMRAAGK